MRVDPDVVMSATSGTYAWLTHDRQVVDLTIRLLVGVGWVRQGWTNEMKHGDAVVYVVDGKRGRFALVGMRLDGWTGSGPPDVQDEAQKRCRPPAEVVGG